MGALRGEQSSNNGDANALFFYPKLATAYRLPSFHPAVNELKVRLAYGETGNQPLYGMKFTALSATNNIEGKPGIVGTGVAGDKDIRPERQQEIEAGVDALLFDGNAVVELTVYQRTITDLLLQRTLPASTGYTTQFFNGGELRNRGVEAMLQVTPVRNGEFEWVSTTTFAAQPQPHHATARARLRHRRLRHQPGRLPHRGGRQRHADRRQRAHGGRHRCDVKKIGDTEPDFRMGFANTLKYGDFSLSFLLDWQQGSDIINLTRFLYDCTRTRWTTRRPGPAAPEATGQTERRRVRGGRLRSSRCAR